MHFLGIDIGGSSVKAAALQDGRVLWTAQSTRYARPSREQLFAAVREAVAQGSAAPAGVGLCVPGILDDRRERVTLSVNVPALQDIPLAELAQFAGAVGSANLTIANDSNATALDLYEFRKMQGRLLVLVIGTGVGASVIDDGNALSVDGDSPGHIGSFDVSLDDNAPLGPDGGRGSLEAYITAPALLRQYGPDMDATLSRLRAGDPPLKALSRAIRIAHAIYRPRHVCLAGGIGIRLKHVASDLRDVVNQDLTRVACADWTLSVGEHDFHAAIGAARLAARAPASK